MLRKSATIKGSYFSLRCKTSDFTQQNSRIKRFFLLSFLFQELEKLEVERIEWIQQHLRQYTTLRHETDMFNQSVSLFYLDLRSKHSRLRTTGTSPVLLDYRRRRMKKLVPTTFLLAEISTKQKGVKRRVMGRVS